MQKKRSSLRTAAVALLLVAIAAVGFAPASASAHEGEYAKFNNCPSTTAEVFKCLYSLTEGGEVVLGKKVVPIVNPVTLQGGFAKPNKETKFSKFFAASNGVTLSPTPQPVPGGLLGLVNCKSISLFLVRLACEAVLENGFTGANATLELAKPASEIQISEIHLASEEGVALELPVKVHLENPFLGSNCYVGSSGTPLMWKLTTAETAPPPPNHAIKGTAGEVEFKDEGRILQLSKGELVDNAWAAPGASGCGGAVIEYLIDPIINLQVGLPAASGVNTAILKTTNDVATAKAVNEH
jgi:hypothetical protein